MLGFRKNMVYVSDLCNAFRIGDEQLEEDADDGPPELLFSYGITRQKYQISCGTNISHGSLRV